MIFIKRGRQKYPVINTPISKLFLVECEEKYPKGFFINDGKKLRFSSPNVNYNRFDIKIDFINSLKIGGIILSFVYFIMLKRNVTKKFTSFGTNREDILSRIREDLKKKGSINDDPFGDYEEE